MNERPSPCEQSFGMLLAELRKQRKLSIRELAAQMGISAGYLCDMEQGRRCAPDGDFLERLGSYFMLDKPRYERLLDLAGKSRDNVPSDLPRYILERDVVRAALRMAKDVEATDAEWEEFMSKLKNRGGLGKE